MTQFRHCSDSLLRSAFASKLAYSHGKINHHPNMSMISSHLHGSSLIPKWYIKNPNGAEAYGYKSGDNSIVIAMKGTSSIRDVISFLDTELIEYHYRENIINMHKGAYRLFDSIENTLTDILVPYIKTYKPFHVTFCGHSLGGGIAMIASAYYASLSNDNIRTTCHTFGSPKIGDESFVLWMKNNVYESIHVKNKGDIIPFYPFHMKYKQGYSHLLENKSTHNLFIQHDLDTYIQNIINDIHKEKNII